MKKLLTLSLALLLSVSFAFAQTDTWDNDPGAEGVFQATIVCTPSLTVTEAYTGPIDLGNFFEDSDEYLLVNSGSIINWEMTGPNDAFAVYTLKFSGNMTDVTTGSIINGTLRADGFTDNPILGVDYPGQPYVKEYAPVTGADLYTISGDTFGCGAAWNFSFEATHIKAGAIATGTATFTFTSELTVTI